MSLITRRTIRAHWLVVAGLLLALLATPVAAEQTSLVTLNGRIDHIDGNQLLLNDFPLTLTATTRVYTASGKAASIGNLHSGMRIEAIVQAPARTVEVINIQR